MKEEAEKEGAGGAGRQGTTHQTAATPEHQSIIGWRTLDLCKLDGVIHLSSRDGPAWPLSAPLVATCRLEQPHEARAIGCKCGIYARLGPEAFRRNPDDFANEPPDLPQTGPGVFGSLTLTGRILRYSTGHRAEFARPRSIILVCVPCWIQTHEIRQPVVVEEHPDCASGLQPRCSVHRTPAPALDAASVLRQLLDDYQIDALPFDAYRSAVRG